MMFSFLTVYVSHKSESHCRGTAPRGCAPGSGELWIPGMAFRMNTPPTTLFSMNDLNQNLLICLFSSHLARPFIRVWEKDWVKYSKMETKQWNGSLSIHHNHVMFLKQTKDTKIMTHDTKIMNHFILGWEPISVKDGFSIRQQWNWVRVIGKCIFSGSRPDNLI